MFRVGVAPGTRKVDWWTEVDDEAKSLWTARWGSAPIVYRITLGRAGRAITLVTQYDVEVYQRIEHMLGKKLEEFPAPQDEVLLLMERVSEAQRMASMDMRSSEARKKPGKRGGSMDDEEADPELHRMMQQSGKKRGGGGGKGKGGGGGGKGKGGKRQRTK